MAILPRITRLLLGALLFCLSISCADAQDLASAHEFVSKLYDSYEHPACPECPNVFGKEASHIFSPSLLRLIRLDEAKTPKGYVGALDFDPICACQDPEGLHVLQLEINPTSFNKASSDVVIGYAATSKDQRTIHLSLLHTPHGWRIDNISSKEEGDLRKLLRSPKQ